MSVDIRDEKYILALADDLDGYACGSIISDLVDAADALRAFTERPQWISVKLGGLPEYGVVVLAASNGAIATAYLDENRIWMFATYGYGPLAPLPTHWMPLPEAPKEEA